MKFLRYNDNLKSEPPKIGALLPNNNVINLSDLYKTKTGEELSTSDLISSNSVNKKIAELIKLSDSTFIEKRKELNILCPLEEVNSLRDAYSFRQHVETSRKNRGLEMIEEFDNFPIYYYSNHNAIEGPGTIEIDSIFAEKLDYEVEIAIVIGKKGINISPQDADSFIYGFTIMNDLSSRQIQMEEMKLNLGPAKGKDFATSIGPYICTKDELNDSIIRTDNGNHYDLELSCTINNIKFSSDNLKNMHWTFAQIISQISKGTSIYPGDIIGSGTCATGCFYELNSGKDSSSQTWLKDGDLINISTNKIGTLSNQIKII